MTSFTTIEETAMLMNDTPAYDFACHYYNTKYGRLKGIKLGMGNTDKEVVMVQGVGHWSRYVMDKDTRRLVDTALKQWEASFKRFTVNEGVSWSMNWFRLRTFGGTGALKLLDTPYTLTTGEREVLTHAFTELLVAYPTLQGTLHIIQIDGCETVLLAGHITKR